MTRDAKLSVEAAGAGRLIGAAGKRYPYRISPLDGRHFLPRLRGNYILARRDGEQWTAIYISQAENLHDRFQDHHKWTCAIKNGATDIHTHVAGLQKEERKAEEDDLLLAHQPPCNEAYPYP